MNATITTNTKKKQKTIQVALVTFKLIKGYVQSKFERGVVKQRSGSEPLEHCKS